MQFASENTIFPSRSVKKWHILYTRPHHEKNIFSILEKDRIEAYLPLQTTLKQWSDRKKKVSEPLFSCYIFVNITIKDYFCVLNIPGVIRYVWFEGKPAVLSDERMSAIKRIIDNEFETDRIDNPSLVGQKVKIFTGPLCGIEGELILFTNKKRVIVRIEEINKCLLVNVPLQFLTLAE